MAGESDGVVASGPAQVGCPGLSLDSAVDSLGMLKRWHRPEDSICELCSYVCNRRCGYRQRSLRVAYAKGAAANDSKA